MANRQVTRSGKDPDGDITKLCGPDFGSVAKADAISHIENRVHTYYTRDGASRADVRVVDHPRYGKYLTTKDDQSLRNNLDNLDNC